ncbi:MAG: OmpA family protein, partial [Spirochaetaceae bacterium]|nr:OmpA family protein [Spirochaetaceae bacterium]
MKRFFIGIFFAALLVNAAFSEVFEFKYKKGDTYRILTKVEEDVIMNGVYSHHAKIVNRVSIEVSDVTADGAGVHNATFMASDESNNTKGKHFSWGNTYKSTYTRSKQGIFTI